MLEETKRFELSEEEFQRTLQDGDADAETRIPIINRLAEGKKTPTCVIVVGMAGSGKVRRASVCSIDAVMSEDRVTLNYRVFVQTTLLAQLQRSLDAPVSTDLEATSSAESGEEKTLKVGYCLNLDPATLLVPFGASIDIRDTIDYKVPVVANFMLMLRLFTGYDHATEFNLSP